MPALRNRALAHAGTLKHVSARVAVAVEQVRSSRSFRARRDGRAGAPRPLTCSGPHTPLALRTCPRHHHRAPLPPQEMHPFWVAKAPGTYDATRERWNLSPTPPASPRPSRPKTTGPGCRPGAWDPRFVCAHVSRARAQPRARAPALRCPPPRSPQTSDFPALGSCTAGPRWRPGAQRLTSASRREAPAQWRARRRLTVDAPRQVQ